MEIFNLNLEWMYSVRITFELLRRRRKKNWFFFLIFRCFCFKQKNPIKWFTWNRLNNQQAHAKSKKKKTWLWTVSLKMTCFSIRLLMLLINCYRNQWIFPDCFVYLTLILGFGVFLSISVSLSHFIAKKKKSIGNMYETFFLFF